MFTRSIHKAEAVTPARPAQLASLICQVPGCTLSVPQDWLMCKEHWLEIPLKMRFEIVTSWNCWISGLATMRSYRAARLAAIVYVGKLHGMDVTAQEAKLKKAIADLQAETTLTTESHLKEENNHE
jgi:hypothetical protein